MNQRKLNQLIRKGEDTLLAHAEAAADKADRASLSLWKTIAGILRTRDNQQTTWLQTYHHVLSAFRSYPAELAKVGTAIEKAVTAAAKIEPLVPPGVKEILPAFDRTDLLRVVYSGDWRARLATQTKLAAPESIAATIATGVQNGVHPRQLASVVKPLVQNVATTARRIARHESIRAAHSLQLEQWESLGPELVVGYQIHAILDERTRPEHRKRSGTVYYRNPRPDQLGFDKMPRPPHEADGSVSFNCRCYLTPVLSEVTAAVV